MFNLLYFKLANKKGRSNQYASITGAPLMFRKQYTVWSVKRANEKVLNQQLMWIPIS